MCDKTTKCCFFQLSSGAVDSYDEIVHISGNVGKKGGDAMFGGCLANCLLCVNETQHDNITINKTDPDNRLWDLVSGVTKYPLSTIIESPKSVVFCSNASLNQYQCTNSSRRIRAYLGESFEVSIMVADELCFPSVQYVQANLDSNRSRLQSLHHEKNFMTEKYCQNYSFMLLGNSSMINDEVQVDFTIVIS